MHSTAAKQIAPLGRPIFFATPRWHLSGVNTMTARLVRDLCAEGMDARFIFTDLQGREPSGSFLELGLPYVSLPIRPRLFSLGRQWKPLCNFLADRAPCVFVPNYDFAAAVVSSVLPSSVAIVGAIRSFDSVYFEQMDRLGAFWNRIVTVSDALRTKAVSTCPHFAGKIRSIPNGINIRAEESLENRSINGPLRLVYTGRVSREQKRVFDLVYLAQTLQTRGVDFVLDVAGDGEDFKEFCGTVAHAGLGGRIIPHGRLGENRINALYRKAHVFLLASEFEGMPNSMLEAMSWGCVPVCSQTRSGASEVIQHGINGFVVRIGVIERYADAICALRDSALWETVSRAARETIRTSYSMPSMLQGWKGVLVEAITEVESGTYVRPHEAIRYRPGHDPASSVLASLRVKLGAFRRRGVPS